MTLIGSTGKRLTGAVGLCTLKQENITVTGMTEGYPLFPVYTVGEIMLPMFVR